MGLSETGFFKWSQTELPTLCFKKSGNVCVTAGLIRHRRSQLGEGAFPVFVWGQKNLLQNKVKILEF